MWEKEKLLVQAISSFPTMFQKASFPDLQNVSLCGNGLTISQTSPGFLSVCSTCLLKVL